MTVVVEYYGLTGKLEFSSEMDVDCERDDCLVKRAIAKIRGLRDNGGQGGLPGLYFLSEGFDGVIRVSFPGEHPQILLPRKPE